MDKSIGSEEVKSDFKNSSSNGIIKEQLKKTKEKNSDSNSFLSASQSSKCSIQDCDSEISIKSKWFI